MYLYCDIKSCTFTDDITDVMISRGESSLPAATKETEPLYTPPIPGVESLQAETIIAAVGICLPGLVRMNLSGIAAVRSFHGNIVAAGRGGSPCAQAKFEKIPSSN